MATYSRVLLSGSAVGGWEALPEDDTFGVVHQSSTTAGVVEDVTIQARNDSVSQSNLNIRIEQDGTLKYAWDVQVAAGAEVTVIDQLAIGPNVDIKIRWAGGLAALPVAPDNVFVFLNGTDMKTFDRDLAGTTVSTNPFVGGDLSGKICQLDRVNKLIMFAGHSFFEIYSAVTGERLFSGSHGLGTLGGFQIAPNQKKGVVWGTGYPKVINYADPTNPTFTSWCTNQNVNGEPAGCNDKGVILNLSGSLLFYDWVSANNQRSSTSVQSGQYVVGDPLGQGWVAFSGTYSEYYGVFTGTSAGRVTLSGFYLRAAWWDPDTGRLWGMGNASDPDMKSWEYPYGTPVTNVTGGANYQAAPGYWSHQIMMATKTAAGNWLLHWIGQDGGSVYRLCQYDVNAGTFDREATTSFNSADVLVGGLTAAELGVSAPAFAGFANRMTP